MGKNITNNDVRVAHNVNELGIMFLETLLFSIWNKTDKKANNDVQYTDEEKSEIAEQFATYLVQRIEQHDTLYDAWVDLSMIIIDEQKKYGLKCGWNVVVE